jgi:murein DD-endopeptidase MepM/ murein hydrolase activator NlpD
VRWTRIWWLVGLAGFFGYVPGLPDELRLLNLAFILPVALRLMQRHKAARLQMEPEAPPLKLPTAPASGGPALVLIRYVTATLLCFVVPSQLRQIIRHSLRQGEAEGRAINAPQAYAPQVRYRLPFEGEWLVLNGGITPKTSHSWDIPGQRYAYDFVVADADGRRWRTDGRAPADYRCYGLPILAPADGEVVAVVEGIRDAPGPGTGWIDIFSRHFPGNAVTIRHAPGEYSFLAHLAPGSVIVSVGERVQQGQVVGRCGNSGHSTEPHLHFHVQDRDDFFKAAGLPVAFSGVAVDGNAVPDSVYPVRGMRVHPGPMRDV